MSTILQTADLDTNGGWTEVEVDANLERDYRSVTSFSGADVPFGLASVVGRLAYTKGRVMPPGGVLREISQTNHGPIPADGAWRARVSSTVVGERAGRRRIAVLTELRRGDANVASVRFLLDWPVGAR